MSYALASVAGGRVAQRAGYFRAFKAGLLMMTGALLVGSGMERLIPHLLVMFVATLGMALTWPALQALVSEGERGLRLQRQVGRYNVIWAFGSAFAYLTGGAMIESWGLRSLFLVPAGIHVIQYAAAAASTTPSKSAIPSGPPIVCSKLAAAVRVKNKPDIIGTVWRLSKRRPASVRVSVVTLGSKYRSITASDGKSCSASVQSSASASCWPIVGKRNEPYW